MTWDLTLTMALYELPFFLFGLAGMLYKSVLLYREWGDFRHVKTEKISNGRLLIAQFKLWISGRVLFAFVGISLIGLYMVTLENSEPPADALEWLAWILINAVPATLFLAAYLEQRLRDLLWNSRPSNRTIRRRRSITGNRRRLTD